MLVETIGSRLVASQVEVRVVGEIHGRRLVTLSSHPDVQAVILAEGEGGRGRHCSRIALVTVGISVRESDAILPHRNHLPVRLVEAHKAAVQLELVVPVLGHLHHLAVQLKASSPDAVAHASNGGSEIGISLALIACQVIKAQSHVSQLASGVGCLDARYDGSAADHLDGHPVSIGQGEALDGLLLLGERIHCSGGKNFLRDVDHFVLAMGAAVE